MKNTRVEITVLLTAALVAAGAGKFTARGQQGAEAPRSPMSSDAEKPGKPLTDQYGDPLPHGALARMGSVRFRHGGPVTALAYSPNGQRLASLGADGKVHVWDAASGRDLRQLQANPDNGSDDGTGRLNKFCFAADGKVLYLLEPGGLQAWEVETGKKLAKLEALVGSETFFAISSNAKTVATSRDNGNQPSHHLWDVESGKEVCQLQLKKAADKEGKKEADEEGDSDVFVLQALDLSGDGKFAAGSMIADTGKSKTAAWDAATGKQLWEKMGPQEESILQFRYSTDGKLLACRHAAGNTLQLLEAATGKVIRETAADKEGQISSFVFTSDSTSLVWAQIAAGGDGVTGLLQKMEVATGKEEKRWEAPEAIFAIALAPDGKTLAFGNSSTIQLFDVAAWKKPQSFGGHDGPIASFALSADGKKLLTAGADNTVRTWDKATGKETGRFDFSETRKDGSTLASASLSPDGKILAVAASKVDPNTGLFTSGAIHLWETATGKEARKFTLAGASGTSLVFSSSGRLLASACTDGLVRIYDLTQGKELRQLKVCDFKGEVLVAGGMGMGGLGFEGVLAFSPDEKTLAVQVPALGDGDDPPKDGDANQASIVIWEIASGKERRRIALKGNAMLMPIFVPGLGVGLGPIDPDVQPEVYRGVVFSPRGKTAALASNTAIQLYDLERAKEIRRFGSPSLNARTVCFSLDGKQLAGGAFDGAVRIWEVDTGTVVCELSGHQSAISSLVFAADGKTLITASADGTALVWDAAALSEEARARPPALPAEKLEALWTDLAGEDAVKADQAMRLLAADPQQAAPFLKKMLKPAEAGADPQALERWIAHLDSNDYNEREKASRVLEKLERLAEPALRQAFAKPQPSLELRRRLERLLEKLEGPVTSPDTLQALRALEVLERIGTAEAREALEALARGAPEAGLTLEAKSALERLNRLP